MKRNFKLKVLNLPFWAKESRLNPSYKIKEILEYQKAYSPIFQDFFVNSFKKEGLYRLKLNDGFFVFLILKLDGVMQAYFYHDESEWNEEFNYQTQFHGVVANRSTIEELKNVVNTTKLPNTCKKNINKFIKEQEFAFLLRDSSRQRMKTFLEIKRKLKGEI